MSRRLVVGWALLCAGASMAALATAGAALRPSPLVEGSPPAGPVVLESGPLSAESTGGRLPGTDLTLTATTGAVRVEAADGGGVGSLPFTGLAQDVRVVATVDGFFVAIRQGNRQLLTRIDRSGVRRDDGLRRRVESRTGALGWPFVLLTLVAALTGALKFSTPAPRGRKALWLLSPAVVGAIAIGLRAALG